MAWLIVGLGNPGPRYARNRHNVGFFVVEELAQRMGGGSFRRHKSARAEVVEGHLGQPPVRVVLLKPQTFMNDSGRAVAAACNFYRIPPEQVVVIHDELDLPPGSLRVKSGGGDNGHNGLRSIRADLGTGEFSRVRLGIGRPMGNKSVTEHVLSDFSPAERAVLPEDVSRAADAVEYLIPHGLVLTKERFNT